MMHLSTSQSLWALSRGGSNKQMRKTSSLILSYPSVSVEASKLTTYRVRKKATK